MTIPTAACPPARPANASVGSAVQRPTPGTAPMAPATTPAMTSPSQTAHQSSDATRGFLEGGGVVGHGAPIMHEIPIRMGSPGLIAPVEIVTDRWGIDLERNDYDAIGSNNWVVHGTRTLSGYPIMANDPHRVQSAPWLRYWVHLVALHRQRPAGAGLPHAGGGKDREAGACSPRSNTPGVPRPPDRGPKLVSTRVRRFTNDARQELAPQ